jgi:hypothetical protein
MRGVHMIGGDRSTGRTTKGVRAVVDRLSTRCNSVIVCHGIAHLRHVWLIMRTELNPTDLVEGQRYIVKDEDWTPSGALTVNFVNGARLFLLLDPEQLSGLRANFAFLDNVVDRREVTLARVLMRELGPLGQEPEVQYTEEI